MGHSPKYVWLIEQQTLAELVSLGAFASTVRYSEGGYDYEVLIGNDEFEYEGWNDDTAED